MRGGRRLKVSVITPSFNQAQFLPDNLRTVSGQKGVEVEHIIVDPGSTDGSTEIARRATHAILINEPDRGQSHGITKGYQRATGDFMVWLNSDDFYPNDGVLAAVVKAFDENPDADIVYGNVNFVDESGDFLRKGFVNRNAEKLLDSFQYQVGIVQPGVFMRRKVFEAVGGPSEDYNYCMDYEYWVRKAAAGFKWLFLDKVLAHHRWWPGMKTSSGRGASLVEHFKVCDTYFGYIHHKWLDRYGEYIATQSDGVVNHASSVDPDSKRACVRLAIERFVTQSMLAKLAAAPDTDKEKKDTLSYINAHAPHHLRVAYDTDELGEVVSSHPDPMAPKRVAWHVFDTKDKSGRRFRTYTVPNNFSRSFDADWLSFEHEKAKERLQRMAARRKDACVIVANGPSLNKSNLDLLGHADVIISNFAIISKPLRAHATYLTVVNDLVAKQGSVPFNELDVMKVFPFWLANTINASESTSFVPATVEPVFCTALGGNFSWRSTVSFFNMQLAYCLGYDKVVLIGFDHSYQQQADLKEGASIKQEEEDPNHFDPRYFQGKTWQAADTGNMEKMYLVARDAYKAAGRSIVNATVGGKLEVFERTTLEEALGLSSGRVFRSMSRGAQEKFAATNPKLLVLDMTAAGNRTATGEIKSNFLLTWTDTEVLQVCKQGPHGLALCRKVGAEWRVTPVDAPAARAAIAEFAPEAILYRPVPDTRELHGLAMETLRAGDVPLVTWIMDDWMARMEAEHPQDWAAMKGDIDWLLRRSRVRLSISGAMSELLVRRYGVPFVPLANGIDPADWAGLSTRTTDPDTFVLRYAGGVAPDMNRASVFRIAEAVERLAGKGHNIRFEISTQPWWKKQIEGQIAAFTHTRIELADRTIPEYRAWLAQADANVIAYNFDEPSLRYTRTSFGNKTPECMISGSPILAHGPLESATIRYLEEKECAAVVTDSRVEAVETALLSLIQDPAKGRSLAARAQEVARQDKNIHGLRRAFAELILQAVSGGAAQQGEPATPELSVLKENFAALAEHARTLEARLAAGEPGDLRGRILALSGALLLGSPTARVEDLRALVAQAPDTPAARHAAAVIDFIARTTPGPERKAS